MFYILFRLPLFPQSFSITTNPAIVPPTTTRTISSNENKKKNLAKLSTATEAVLACAHKHNIDMIIHGHTHSKQVDTYQINDKTVTRIIMPSWEPENCSQLTLNPRGEHAFKAINLT